MPKKQIVGTVISTKMDKTLKVQVDHTLRHRLYEKRYTKSKKYFVHDENGQASVGDIVRIEESRPLSKNKRWTLVEIINKSEA